MIALETLSDCGKGKILISKGKEYKLEKEGYSFHTRYYIIDNHGDRLYLTKEEVLSKFKSCRETLSV